MRFHSSNLRISLYKYGKSLSTEQTTPTCDFSFNGSCAQQYLVSFGQGSTLTTWLGKREKGFQRYGCLHLQRAKAWICDQLYDNFYNNGNLSQLEIQRKIEKMNWLFCIFSCEQCQGSIFDWWLANSIWAESKIKEQEEKEGEDGKKDIAGFFKYLQQQGYVGNIPN